MRRPSAGVSDVLGPKPSRAPFGAALAIIEDARTGFTLGAAPSAADVVSAVAPPLLDSLAIGGLTARACRGCTCALLHARSKRSAQ